ncbi:MAG: hypothetical protein JNL85_16350 [Rubrivivax sp.]|nr:hypothetical protein [Rubrivivax sp.]
MRPMPGESANPRCSAPTNHWRRRLRAGLSLFAALALGLLLWTFGADRRPIEVAAAPAWGDEAALARPAAAADWLPMAPANACGLGASSCFKCHNGKRAAAPKSDPANGRWHAQHAKVDNSCVGCHKGNPRVLKDDVAHAKMIAKPRDDSAGSCSGCHRADLEKIKAAYTAGGK